MCNLNETTSKTIDEHYRDYLQYKSTSNTLSHVENSIREKLLERFVTERNNLLEDEMFISLINDESRAMLSGLATSSLAMSIVAPVKALRRANGLDEEDIQLIKKLSQIELANEERYFIVDSRGWLLSKILGEEPHPHSKRNVISYVFHNDSDLIQIETVNFLNAEYFDVVQDVEELHKHEHKRRRIYRSIVALAFINYSFGDLVAGEYFSMKAIQLNHTDNPDELLLKLLNNVLFWD